MADTEVTVTPTPINPVEIKGAIAFSAEHARVWAEGTDSEVEKLGGEHSAKGWAGSAFEENKEYTDEQVSAAKTELYGAINTQSVNVLNQAKDYTDTSISQEVSARQQADNNLQTQIDAITSASDVFDIVGTYQDLLEYDTSIVPVNDIIKVLEDESRDDAATYYRWNGTQWVFIGSEGPTYTKAEADAKFLTQSEVEEDYLSKADAASTYLTQASAASTYATQASIGNGTITLVQGGQTKGSFTVNQSGNTSITLDGGGGVAWGNLTGTLSDQTDLQNALDAKQNELPSGTTGQYLQKTASGVQWNDVDALPSQSGQSGKFLTTNGTEASWATISAFPTLTWYTGNTGTSVTIADTSSANLVKVYKNGLLLQPIGDYDINGTTLTLVTALVSTDKLAVEVC